MIIGTAVHLEPDPAQALCWNLEALSRAQHVPERAAEFLASLYVNLGQSYEMLGDLAEAERYVPRPLQTSIGHSASRCK